MNSALADLTERQRVWVALSDLFLDTDVTLHFDYIERELTASPFTIDEIDAILRDEVAPICLFNLYDIAGEWAGFRADWLIKAIEAYLSRPRWFRRLRRRGRAKALDCMVSEWPELRARIIAKRAGENSQ